MPVGNSNRNNSRRPTVCAAPAGSLAQSQTHSAAAKGPIIINEKPIKAR